MLNQLYIAKPVKPRALRWQKMANVSTAGEYSFEIHPLALHVNPHIKEGIDAVQLVVPSVGLFFKYLVVRRKLHGVQTIDVLLHFVEKIIPTLDQPRLVLVIHKL